MTDGEHQAKRLEKTIRVSVDTHRKFLDFQFDGHFRSADVAMAALLPENILRIQVPAEVMARWKEEAAASGYPLEQWAVQRMETWPAKCMQHAGEVREALDELVAIKRALEVANVALGEAGPIQHVGEGE